MASSESLSARIAASNPHKQTQSPIFASLYPELRNMVFRHALTEYDDPTRPYSKHEYYYRPGLQFAGKIDTNLLLTCRLIYLETHLAPITLNEHVFWMYRAPPGRLVSNHNAYFGRMTPQQRAAVRRLRFFTQLFWLEGRMAQEWPVGLVVPKVAITIRHSDWWNWENGQNLRIDDPSERWGGWIGSIPGLQEVVLELETIDVKREQLEERVQAALAWKFPLAENGGSLVHDGKEPINSTWLGTSKMSPGQQYDNSEDSEEGEETDEEEYSDDYDHSNEEGSESDGGSGVIIEADEEINLQEPDIPVLVPEEAQVVADAHLQESHTDVEGSRLSALGEESTEAPQQLDVGQGQDVSSPGELDRDDLDYPLDLKLHIRKLRFINESRLP